MMPLFRTVPRRIAALPPPLLFWSTLLLTGVVFYLRFGYNYGLSDQDELIPYLLHLLDPNLFENDWFVQKQGNQFNVRTPTVWLLYGLCQFLPPVWAVELVYGACLIGIGWGVYRLALTLTNHPLASATTVFLTLAVTTRWTLGGNDLLYNQLVPEMLGWVFVLPALVLFLQGQASNQNHHFLWAGVLLGVASWFQLLTGSLAILLLKLILCPDLRYAPHRKSTFKALCFLIVPFVIITLPMVLPLLLQRFSTDAVWTGGPSLFYISALFRNPHHYLFLSFGWESVLRFGSLLLLALPVLWRHPRWAMGPHDLFIRRALWSFILIGVFAFIFTELISFSLVASLQFFKLSVLIKILLITLLCKIGYTLIWQDEELPSSHGFKPWFGIGLLSFTWSMLRLFGPAPMYLTAHEQSAWGQVEQWAKTHTAPDVVFAVPPSATSFRSYAERSIVVNFKAFPFEPNHIPIWFERLMDMAPIIFPERGSPHLLPNLDQAYHNQSPAQWCRVVQKYALTYIAADTSLTLPSAHFTQVFSVQNLRIYKTEHDPR